MLNWLTWIGTHGTKIMASSVAIGLLIPPLAALVKPTLIVWIFALVVGSIVRVDFSRAKQTLVNPAKLIAGLIFIMGITPVLMLGLLWLGLSDVVAPGIALGLVLLAGTSSINSTPAIAALLGLNTGLALTITLFGMALAPFTLYLLVTQMEHSAFLFDPIDMLIRLGLMIAFGFAAALIIRRIIGIETIQSKAKTLDGINVLLMVMFAIGVMDGVTASFLENPAHILTITAYAFATSVLLLIVTTLIFWPWDKMAAATIGLASGNPNTGIIIGAIGLLLPQDTWFLFAVLQLPIFLMPSILKPIYQRLLSDHEI